MFLPDNDVSIEDVSDLVNSGYDPIKQYYNERSRTEKSEKIARQCPTANEPSIKATSHLSPRRFDHRRLPS